MNPSSTEPLPAWALMWTLAALLFALLKALTWWRERRGFRALAGWRRLGYLTAWVGLDPAPFLAPRFEQPLPKRTDWLGAMLQVGLGAVLVWAPPPGLALHSPDPARAWIGLIGLALLLHFGLFRLAALTWQLAGVPVRPIMANPLASRTLAEFWSCRWNLAFRDVSHRFLFRPIQRRHGAPVALMAVFLGSGLVHELVISLPARGGWGLPTLYFCLQGVGVLVERRLFAGRTPGAIGGRAYALALAALPAPLLFHPPFLEGVALPFLGILCSPLGGTI